MNYYIWFWLCAAVVFGVVEALTAGLVSIWFVCGAVIALAAAFFHASVFVQLAVFVAVSALALILTRPLVKKLTSRRAEATNSDRVLGQTVKVTETIDNANNTGAVYVDGKTWTARSEDGSVIPAGQLAEILHMEGVKLFVKRHG